MQKSSEDYAERSKESRSVLQLATNITSGAYGSLAEVD
jgi:hypothetical protein